jgi:hypothetical protein
MAGTGASFMSGSYRPGRHLVVAAQSCPILRAAMSYLRSTDPGQRALADVVVKAARDELRQARRWPRKWHVTASATHDDHQLAPRNGS